MRFRMIEAERANYPIRILCRAMQVSRSGYYAWKKRGVSDREAENERVLARIRQLYLTRKQCYGSPRMTVELRDEGHSVGENRVARIMREAGIAAHMPRRFRVTTRASQRPPARCLLDRDFEASEGDCKWVTDISVPQKAA